MNTHNSQAGKPSRKDTKGLGSSGLAHVAPRSRPRFRTCGCVTLWGTGDLMAKALVQPG